MGCVHLCRVAGDPTWQVTLHSCEMEVSINSYIVPLSVNFLSTLVKCYIFENVASISAAV